MFCPLCIWIVLSDVACLVNEVAFVELDMMGNFASIISKRIHNVGVAYDENRLIH